MDKIRSTNVVDANEFVVGSMAVLLRKQITVGLDEQKLQVALVCVNDIHVYNITLVVVCGRASRACVFRQIKIIHQYKIITLNIINIYTLSVIFSYNLY